MCVTPWTKHGSMKKSDGVQYALNAIHISGKLRKPNCDHKVHKDMMDFSPLGSQIM